MTAPVVFPSQGIETRLVRELVIGTTPGSPAWKRVNGFGIKLGAQVEVEPYAPPGALIPTLGMVNDDYSTGDYEGRLDFNGMAYPLCGILGQPTITALGGSPAAYQWLWSWNGRRPNRPISFSVHNGFAESSDLATGYIFNSLSIGGGRSNGFDVKGSGFGRVLSSGNALGSIVDEVQTATKTGTWSAGTYTITVVETGETTAAIAFDAVAATIQAALELLAGIDPGDITVTGGPLSTTPVVFTYGGIYAGRNVAALTIDAALVTGSTPGVGVVTTTPGADNVTDITPVPAGAVLGNVYLDTTRAGLGGSELLHCYDMSLDISERMARVRPINKSKSSDTQIDVGSQEHTCKLVLGRNATADAQLARLRANTFVFPRVEWEGDTISGGNKYLLQFDLSTFFTEIGMPDDTDNVSTREFTARLAIDPVSQVAIGIKLVNTISGL